MLYYVNKKEILNSDDNDNNNNNNDKCPRTLSNLLHKK